MKKILLSLLITAVMLFSGCTFKNSAEKVLITVNGEGITQGEYDEAFAKQPKMPILPGQTASADDQKLYNLIAKEKTINDLIVKKLLMQEIIKRNIVVSEEEIQAYKDKVYEQAGGAENFKQVLASNNLTDEDFLRLAQEDIQLTKLIDSLGMEKVSDKDVQKFYDENKATKFTYPDQVRASHILIMASKDSIKAKLKQENPKLEGVELDAEVQAQLAKAKEKAENILKQAKANGANFEELAKQYSDDPGSAQKGGDLGFFSKDQMVKSFADAAFSQKPGTISDLVKSEYGYHIIKVVDRKKAGVMALKEIKDEIKKYLEDEQKIKTLQAFIEGLKPQMQVIYIEKTYDPEEIKKEVQKITSKYQQQAGIEQIVSQEEQQGSEE